MNFSVGQGFKRTEEEWTELKNKALHVLYTNGDTQAQQLAMIVLEYAALMPDVKRQNDQITELQNRLNVELKKARAARGITE